MNWVEQSKYKELLNRYSALEEKLSLKQEDFQEPYKEYGVR